jgi:DNA mismatch repair protein MutS
MDAALGPPEKMADRGDELTPMMRQYFDLCRRYDDSLVLFQVGDFYETFCEAAAAVARLCETTLTQREDSTGTYPMAGIPVDNAASYVETLLDAGYRVAVADQVEDPEEVSGVVERAVTRIVTPGTLTEDELLASEDSNYVACLVRDDPDRFGLAVLEVSTGEFVATTVEERAVRDEIERFAPAEAVVGPDAPPDAFPGDCVVTEYDDAAFDAERARERVESYFGPPENLLATAAETRACGALLGYAEYARGGQDGRLDYLHHLTRYDPREYVLLDRVALRSLELFERRAVHGDEDATLAGVLDETATALGSRRLAAWLRRPLLEADRIEARLDAVEELVGDVRTREETHDLLREVYDVERLISRVSRGHANARDLRALKSSLDVVPDLRDLLADADAGLLRDLRDGMDELGDVRGLIGRAIRENPPQEITEGAVIEPGYDDELDDLRETERSGQEWVDALEERERERTGIESLKVGHTQVHGYYIEVTDANLDRVPDDYTRRQTLKNAERFVTPELKHREDDIIRASQHADDLEHELFRAVRSSVADESERVQALASKLAALDVLVSLAEVAAKHDYCRPELGADGIHVEGGRHPVVERTQASFVPNGIDLTRAASAADPERADRPAEDDRRVAVVTGPNMSGKSTFMRQIALVVVLAQVGSFVPAESAEVELVDRVFTRIGASDDIAGGRSTFMVEMTELADILGGATERSLVLLDEVGRGTSTADGLAIARAVTEHLHDEVGAWTLFATHHHDLTAVADDLDAAFNLHFDAERVEGDVSFDHEVREGAATASYGVEVAGEAGVPDAVVDRAREFLRADDAPAETQADTPADTPDNPRTAAGDGTGARIEEVVADVDLADTTPMEALNLLADLKRRVE